MFYIKEWILKKQQNEEEKQFVEKLIEIEKSNLEIEMSKFHHSIGKANMKIKKIIYLKYIQYYLDHLHLTKKDMINFKVTSNVKTYLNLLIPYMRAKQILNLVQKNCCIPEENKRRTVKIASCYSNQIQIECDWLVENTIRIFELIKEQILKKHRYNNEEKIELEKIIKKIELEKDLLSNKKINLEE